MLAQVYLIEPEEAEAKSQSTSRRAKRETLSGLQDLADANGIGELYAQIRSGVRGILSAQAYTNRVWYRLGREDGGVKTVLIVSAISHAEDKSGGVRFTVHADRLKTQFGTDFETLRTWLPPDTHDHDVSTWPGSSEEEKKGARGLRGYFQSTEEVDKFLNALRSAAALSRPT